MPLEIPVDQKPMSESTRNAHFLQVRDAERTAASQVAKLLRPDGQPLFTDHEDRVRSIHAERDQVVTAKEELCYSELKQAEQWIDQIDAAQANPISQLNAEDLARAANMRGFVEADCRRFRASDLAPQVQAILAGTDRGLKASWWHALLGRIAELDAAVPDGYHRSAADVADRQQLGTMVEELAAGLRDPALDKLREAQVRRQDSARQLLRELRELVQPRRVDDMAQGLAATGAYSRLG